MESMSKPDGPSNQKYDVFLSFRGEDTRGVFVSHLYEALDRNGIYTYKDDETLPRGEIIAPALLTAIENSSYVVVVFSKNYPNSSWCLEELAKIMECNKEKGLTILPVFYDVKPSDVRKQKGVFGEAFSRMESESRVRVWREALVEAANISGWEPKQTPNGNECECIKEIVEKISLGLQSIMSNVNEDLVGLESRIQEVKSLLEQGNHGVRLIGIWGVGGVGKTTVADAVYNEISRDFEGCSFVENVRENSSKSGLEKLQEKVLREVLGDKNMTVGGVKEGERMIATRLRRKKVLMVLDDVNHISQLEALARSHKWFGEGSRIIITTRDEHILNAHGVSAIYNINLLKDNEAIQLLSRHAFRTNAPEKGFEDLSRSVVSYAAGLPLALKVLGSFLCDKDENEWESALARLKDIPDSEITKVLKISYDGLDRDEKDIFLDIACFHRRKPKESVIEVLSACGFHAQRGVGVLIRKSLITINADGQFDMHDLIEEMGRYIVQGEHPNNPQKHTRIWEEEKLLQLCTMDATTENYTTEALKYEWRERPVNFVKVLSNMKNVRMINAEIPTLWKADSDEGLPNSFQGDRLGCLVLHHNNLTHLWRGYKSLPCLKMLDLSRSQCLMSTPDLSGVPNLERLILRECRELVEIHPSIGFHQKLHHLDLTHCEKLKVFPPIIHMKSLTTLNFDQCYELAEFPEIQGNMDSLTHLSMFYCRSIEVVPSSLGRYMANLVSLYMKECSSLKRFEGSLSSLKCFRRLDLQGCSQLENLPKGLDHEKCSLEELLLSGCRSLGLEYIRYLSGIVSLKKLNLSSNQLEDEEDTVDDIGKLPNLIELDLSSNKITRLPSNMSQIAALKSLNLSGCHNLQELSMRDLPPTIAILVVDACYFLKSIADLPMNCERLHYVSLAGCSRLMENKQSGIIAEKISQSILQGNEIGKHGFVIRLPGIVDIPKGFVSSLDYKKTYLELPPNMIHNYNGFLLTVLFNDDYSASYDIHIKKTTLHNHRDQPKLDKLRDCKGRKDNVYTSLLNTCLTYVPLSSPTATKWLNSASNMLSFEPGYKCRHKLLGIGVKLLGKQSISEPSPTGETPLTTEAEEDSGFVKWMRLSVQKDELCVDITRPYWKGL